MIAIGDQTEWVEKGLERLRYEYDLKNTDYCIDIGSYRNEWANEIKKRYGCHVECFDALDNRAAWIYDGEMGIGGVFLYSSVFEKTEKRKVKCEDIAKYLDREVAVMKINIEGGEYELLNYILYKGLQKNIRNIQIQFHKVDDIVWELEEDLICKQLMNTHKITFKHPFVWENWERK